jgi:hypothetical protein
MGRTYSKEDNIRKVIQSIFLREEPVYFLGHVDPRLERCDHIRM